MPSIPDDATADVNMFLILGALRGFNTSMLALRAGQWRGNPPPPLGHDPEGKVLGILGMGGIGRNLKKKAEAFGMSVIYHNRRKLSEEQSGGAEYVSFDELLARSDVLSLNLPLNVSTNFSTPSQRLLEAPQSLSQNPPHSRLSPFLSLIVSLSFRSVARSLASLPFSLACRFRLSHQNNPRPGKTRRARDLGERYPRFFPSFHEAFHRPAPFFSPPFLSRAVPEHFHHTSIILLHRVTLPDHPRNVQSAITYSHHTHPTSHAHKIHSHRRRLHCLSHHSPALCSGEESAVPSPNIPNFPTLSHHPNIYQIPEKRTVY